MVSLAQSNTPNHRRRIIIGVFCVLLIVVLVFPWKHSIRIHGVARPARFHTVFAPEPALILDLKTSSSVRVGNTLVQLDIPELMNRREHIEANIAALESRLSGLIADPFGQHLHGTLQQQLLEQYVALNALEKERERLDIKAPFSGEWIEIDPSLGPDIWIGTSTPIGILTDPQHWIIDAYITQKDIEHLNIGATARFYDALNPEGVSAQVSFTDCTRSVVLPHSILDSHYGGPIPTQNVQGRAGIPTQALYRVRLRLDQPLATLQESRGRIVIEGSRSSFLWNGLQKVLSWLSVSQQTTTPSQRC